VPLINVPPAFKVPELLNVICEHVPAEVILPETVTVPVDIVSIAYLVPVLPCKAIEEQDRIPLPTAIWFVPLLGLCIVTAPETVRLLSPLMLIDELVLFAKLIELQTAATFTVTVTPPFITTASAEVGTAAPPHVAVEFQLPLTLAVRVAPNISENSSRKTAYRKNFKILLQSFKLFNILQPE
jgi:hypothetical protein